MKYDHRTNSINIPILDILANKSFYIRPGRIILYNTYEKKKNMFFRVSAKVKKVAASVSYPSVTPTYRTAWPS